MKNESTNTYSLSDLCALAEFTPRTIRYYVQSGLVDRPVGETRAARYGLHHLEQLLLIKKWTTAGVSLERIRELLHGANPPMPEQRRAPGTVEVCTRLVVAQGVELLIDAGRASLSPEQVRDFIQSVMSEYARVTSEVSAPESPQS